MSQHKTKHNNIFSIILSSLAVVMLLAGCRDDVIYQTVDIPEGMVEVTGEVIFKPLVPVEIKTRADATGENSEETLNDAPEGEKYRGIKTLYLFFFNGDGTRNDASGPVPQNDLIPIITQGSSHQHISFTKTIKKGTYNVFAVANVNKEELDGITLIDDLRKIELKWDDDIDKDLEMFGVFASGSCDEVYGGDNTEFEGDVKLTLTKSCTIHSWLRRATSKVTVDFNGANLLDGVTVHIRNAVLKDVASGSYLGENSQVTISKKNTEATDTQDDGNTEQDGFSCQQSQYALTYGIGNDQKAWPYVSNKVGEQTFTPADASWGDKATSSFHDDDAMALPCYENRQGKHEDKDKRQDNNNDGIIDSEPSKDGVDKGTYLEVEGYYVANRSDYKSEGKIIYRFMLGQDAINDFDLIRNHHYKITMNFKGFGNDVDWHIEYAEKVLDLTYPQDVDYQGRFFEPDIDYSGVPNAGHKFDNHNAITLTSYSTDDPDTFIPPTDITYTYYNSDNNGGWIQDTSIPSTGEGGWLTKSEETAKGATTYTFEASMANPINQTLNTMFTTTPVGTATNPINLGSGETANSYIINAPGWYSIPLVYGNGNTYETNSDGKNHFVNHLGALITNKNILESIVHTNVGVKLIWQDAMLIAEPKDIVCDIANNRIKFHVKTIQEGNAVIALIDNTLSDKYEFQQFTTNENTQAIWSWHIWATPLFSGDFEKDITLLNNDGIAYDVMPVNLGWCSNGEKIDYYPRRKCEITFTVQGKTLTRTIEQYPHFNLPRGNHPYYQWGRKDPFVGTNAVWANKERWVQEGTSFVKKTTEGKDNPPRLYNEPPVGDGKKPSTNDDRRKNTEECLNVLVLNPDKWHNATRNTDNDILAEWDKPNSTKPNPFYSTNVSYDDLWSYNGKTVYDPCPPGYQVGSPDVFSGFICAGDQNLIFYHSRFWNDVREDNMSDYYKESSVNQEVIELYADSRKLHSIIFPYTGYRDYDSNAEVVDYPQTTDLVNYNGFVWTNKAADETNSYHLKFHRDNCIIKDAEGKVTTAWLERGSRLEIEATFYNTDGFGVRPVRIETKGVPNQTNGGLWGF